MPALQVKDCPANIYERLRACARKENRSISQQALTIIQQYLEAYDASQISNTEEPTLYVSTNDETSYINKRLKAFEKINKLPPLPESPSSPTASVILAQIREEEAR